MADKNDDLVKLDSNKFNSIIDEVEESKSPVLFCRHFNEMFFQLIRHYLRQYFEVETLFREGIFF